MSSKNDSDIGNQKQFYDMRYSKGYMKDFSDLYESCRLLTIKEMLNDLNFNPFSILDYGCGEGRYLKVWKEFFPNAYIYGSDISDIGLKIAEKNFPYVEYISMSNENIKIDDKSIDMICSIEVLEHVRDVKKTISEFGRVLKPNGMFIITTPCANKYSLEWLINKVTGGLQKSFDGYCRFASDEPGHLRRLNSDEVKSLFSSHGMTIKKLYYRAHFFTTIMAFLPMKILPVQIRVKISMLDWYLFKKYPNGATMIVIGQKEEMIDDIKKC